MMLKRMALFLASALAALLLAEGAISLGAGGSLRGRAAPESRVALPEPPADGDRHDAGAASTGMYRMHEDPRVRYVLKSGTDVEILDTRVRSNELGMRVRPGPEPAEGALRIAIVGDSVAFSYGVADDFTMAAQLERLLVASRGPEARPIAVFTVAIPSWNHRNALGFLTDHWNALRPDIVVYLPIDNDLSDAGAVYESGKLRIDPDPFQPDPLLFVNRSLLTAMESNFVRRAGSDEAGQPDFGPVALELDLTPESTRRYDDNARSLAVLAGLAERHGARLLIVQTARSLYTLFLEERLLRVAPQVPILRLERLLPRQFTLIVDGHANATSCGVRANWIAADLLARGWVDRGAGLPLPAVPPEYTALLDLPFDATRVAADAARARETVATALHDEIDLVSGRGLRQIVGGVNSDLTLRMHGLFVLRASGPDVRIELQPLADRPDLYPFDMAVELGGVPAGSITVGAGEITVATLPLPESVPRGAPFEVKLMPATWCVKISRDRSQVASLRLLRIACRAP